MIHDFHDDNTGALLRDILAENVDSVPDFVIQKSASLVPSEAFRAEKRVWAWPDRKKFACDTPEDTWLSLMYFQKTAGWVPGSVRDFVEANLAHYAEAHGLTVSTKLAAIEAPALTSDAFLVNVVLSPGTELFKAASEYADEGVLRLYPIHTKEALADSVLLYPRGLEGELGSERAKVASQLVALCQEHQVQLTDALAEDVRPMKRSSLAQQIGMRVGILFDLNNRAAEAHKLASQGYNVEVPAAIEAKVIDAYHLLAKQATEDVLPKRFWDNFTDLDKVASFTAGGPLLDVSMMRHREFEDDAPPGICKLANQYVNLEEVMAKVSSQAWQDWAPEMLENMYNYTKAASILQELPPNAQLAILRITRGY